MIKLKEFYSKIPKIFKNKYVIISIIFAIWITFLDESNLISLNKNLNQLKEKEVELETLKIENEKQYNYQQKLDSNKRAQERFARENLLFKKKGEHIIIIKDIPNNESNIKENKNIFHPYSLIIFIVIIIFMILLIIWIVKRKR